MSQSLSILSLHPRMRLWIAAIAFSALGTDASAQTYDLNADWSDITNPNGVWSLRAGASLLPHVNGWPLGGFSTQQGWALGNSLPFWFQSTETPSFTHDWMPGDIVVHTQDNYNGSGHGAANLLWTSPINGAISISGSIWEGRDIRSIGGGLRGNQWNLYVNGSLLSSGQVYGGDPYSRQSPMSFTQGSGGSNALTAIPIVAGQTVMLEIVRTSADGDFVGTNITISAVPEPEQYAMLLLGIGVMLYARKLSKPQAHMY